MLLCIPIGVFYEISILYNIHEIQIINNNYGGRIMLKQIKSLGLSLVIGSMLVAGMPVVNNECHAMTATQTYNEMTEEDRVVEMYKYICEDIYNVECSDKEEAMVRKYFKYKTIKEYANSHAEKWQQQREYVLNGPINTSSVMRLSDVQNGTLQELFPNINEMSVEQQRVLRFMYAYKFNRHLNVKNIVGYCVGCKSEYITDKYAEMLGKGNICCNENMPVSKLTAAGLKAAYTRKAKNSMSNLDPTLGITIIEETDNEIVIGFSSSMENKTKTVTYNKYTRVKTSIENK
jgi:hypothetical protein